MCQMQQAQPKSTTAPVEVSKSLQTSWCLPCKLQLIGAIC